MSFKKKYIIYSYICFSKPRSSIVSLIDSDEENGKVKKTTYCVTKGKWNWTIMLS